MNPPMETEEDIHLIKESILLPFVLDALEHDIGIIGSADLKLALFCISLFREMQQAITAELTSIRGKSRMSGLKIYDQQHSATGVSVHYLCRGYHHKFTLLWGQIKAETEIKLAAYSPLHNHDSRD